MVLLEHTTKSIEDYLSYNITPNHMEILATTLLNLQDQLNMDSNGENYKNTLKNETTGRFIRFQLAYRAELIELLDSIDWKHWKVTNKEPDLDNMLIELVDILHFILSELLIMHNYSVLSKRDITAELATVRYVVLTQDLLTEFKKSFVYDSVFKTYVALASDKKPTQEANDLLVTAISASLTSRILSNRHDENELNIIEGLCKYHMNEFLMLANHIFGYIYYTKYTTDQLLSIPTMDDVIQLYLLKNVLNKFRQDHGYKDGTYVKQWFGKEDNEYLFQIRDELDKSVFESTDTIYAKLHDIYLEVLHGDKTQDVE